MTDELDPRWKPDTLAVALGRPDREPGAPIAPPLVATSTYHAGGPVGYGRSGNPTWTELERTVAALERAERAVAFSSGLAALNAVLELVPVGGVVVAASHPYSGTRVRFHELHDRGTLVVRWVDLTDHAAVAQQLQRAHLLWAETPSNPMMQVCDLAFLSSECAKAGALMAVDNTFATPIAQQPLTFGADIVVHSATKFLSGHSDLLGGIAACKNADVADQLVARRELLGAIPSAFDAWLTLRGIRTLGVRMARSQASAMTLAERLSERDDVSIVRYPGLADDPGHALAAKQMTGFGAMLSIEVLGGAQRAEHMCALTKLWVHATSLGGVESMIERRARWDWEHPDTPEDLIRLSVGLEDVDDLWRDLERVLEATE